MSLDPVILAEINVKSKALMLAVATLLTEVGDIDETYEKCLIKVENIKNDLSDLEVPGGSGGGSGTTGDLSEVQATISRIEAVLTQIKETVPPVNAAKHFTSSEVLLTNSLGTWLKTGNVIFKPELYPEAQVRIVNDPNTPLKDFQMIGDTQTKFCAGNGKLYVVKTVWDGPDWIQVLDILTGETLIERADLIPGPNPEDVFDPLQADWVYFIHGKINIILNEKWYRVDPDTFVIKYISDVLGTDGAYRLIEHPLGMLVFKYGSDDVHLYDIDYENKLNFPNKNVSSIPMVHDNLWAFSGMFIDEDGNYFDESMDPITDQPEFPTDLSDGYICSHGSILVSKTYSNWDTEMVGMALGFPKEFHLGENKSIPLYVKLG